jgi:hypothetical protein
MLEYNYFVRGQDFTPVSKEFFCPEYDFHTSQLLRAAFESDQFSKIRHLLNLKVPTNEERPDHGSDWLHRRLSCAPHDLSAY